MTRSIPLLLMLALAAPAFAQSPTPAPNNCSIALPYNPTEVPDCSPRAAAAYDFAFCGVTFLMMGAAVPQAEAAQSESMKKTGAAYVKISEALSNADTLTRNAGLTKAYFEFIGTQERAVAESSMDYVRVKCGNIAAHHDPVIRELMQKMKGAPPKAR